MRSGNRLLLVFTFGVAVVVGAIISLAVGSWWVLAAAVAVHVIGTVMVLGLVSKRLQEEDKPDPVTEARLADREDKHPSGPRIRTDPTHLR
jgi:membrane protein implicated in regulation of membrane protease activity